VCERPAVCSSDVAQPCTPPASRCGCTGVHCTSSLHLFKILLRACTQAGHDERLFNFIQHKPDKRLTTQHTIVGRHRDTQLGQTMNVLSRLRQGQTSFYGQAQRTQCVSQPGYRDHSPIGCAMPARSQSVIHTAADHPRPQQALPTAHLHHASAR
jgi:hypothetical protein